MIMMNLMAIMMILISALVADKRLHLDDFVNLVNVIVRW